VYTVLTVLGVAVFAYALITAIEWLVFERRRRRDRFRWEQLRELLDRHRGD
jgi:hypothetical protein